MKVAVSSIRTKNIKIDRYELVTSLQAQGDKVSYIGQQSEDKINSDYKKYNIPFLSLPITRSKVNPFSELLVIYKSKKLMKEHNIEHLIAYGIRTFPVMVFSAKLAKVKKIVCIVNGSGRLFRLKGMKGFITKSISYPMIGLALCLANKVLFQNPDDLKMLKDLGLLCRKNYDLINGSGVNLRQYQVQALEKKPVFLMIGRLTGDKGVNEYILAAIEVKKNFPEAEFHLVGPMDNMDGSINFSNLEYAKKNRVVNIHDKVDDVKPYIKKCRFFVLPSYHEGTPRTVLEAMSMGRPIITTDVTGCRETVEEGVNGFKVPPRDIATLSKKMQWMIQNPLAVEEMALESRRLAEEKYDIHKINQKILKALK